VSGGRRLLRRQAFEQDLDDELRHYLEMVTEEGMRSGLSRDRAARNARIELRGVESVKERVRSAGWEVGVESVAQDLRIAARGLRRSTGFAAVTILSLALGIGAATALFSVVDGVLLKPLPARQPDELVLLTWTSGTNPPGRNFTPGVTVDPRSGAISGRSFSYLAWQRMSVGTSSLSHLFGVTQPIALGDPGAADTPTVQFVTGNYYEALGPVTRNGRLLTSDDDRETAEPVAVISQRAWDRLFGRDPTLIGRSIPLGDASVTIVGVTPSGFTGVILGEEPDFTVPLASVDRVAPRAKLISELREQPWVWGLRLMGRLSSGASLAEARAQLQPAFAAAALEGFNLWPRASETSTPRDVPELQLAVGSQGFAASGDVLAKAVSLMIWIVGFTLAVVCFNVANMLAARAATRRGEFAVRLATGAPRTRLVRQLITESFFLVGCGAALGTVFAFWAKDLFLSWITRADPGFVVSLVIDARVLLFACGATVVIGLVLAMAPVSSIARVELVQSIKGVGRGSAVSRSAISKALLSAQVAGSVVLLVGAGLFARTLVNLHAADVGFDTSNLLLFRSSVTDVFASSRGPDALQVRPAELFAERIMELSARLEALPGVVAVTYSANPLLSGENAMPFIYVPERVWVPEEDRTVYFQEIGPAFFETLGMPIRRGRTLTRDDMRGSAPILSGSGGAVVVNEALARRYFPGVDPIGRRIGVSKGMAPLPDSALLEIVGVVGDAKYTTVRQDIPATIYAPFTLPVGVAFSVRTAGDPRSLEPAIRETVRQAAPDFTVSNFRTQREAAALTFARERHFATLAALSAGLAVLLTCIGLYGLLSYHVANRSREIGIRMALGARRGRVMGLVMSETIGLLGAGVLFGLGVVWMGGRAIATQLYELPPTDPTASGVAILLIGAASGAAAFLPAKRASRIDPAVILRED
jgi:predicted permease